MVRTAWNIDREGQQKSQNIHYNQESQSRYIKISPHTTHQLQRGSFCNRPVTRLPSAFLSLSLLAGYILTSYRTGVILISLGQFTLYPNLIIFSDFAPIRFSHARIPRCLSTSVSVGLVEPLIISTTISSCVP